MHYETLMTRRPLESERWEKLAVDGKSDHHDSVKGLQLRWETQTHDLINLETFRFISFPSWVRIGSKRKSLFLIKALWQQHPS